MARNTGCTVAVMWATALLLVCSAVAQSEDGPSFSPIITTQDTDLLDSTGPVLSAVQPNLLDVVPDSGEPADGTSTRTHKRKKERKKNNNLNVVTDEEFESEDELLEGNDTVNGNETSIVSPRIPYTTAPVNNSYVSMDDFSARGMEHLYFITNLFLRLIHRDEEIPQELQRIVSRELESPTLDEEQALRVLRELRDEWDVLVVHYIGIVGLLILGLLLAAIMPVVGLFVMCCRCAGRCGASDITYDKRHDPCKRGTLAAFKIVFLVLALLGVVCAFVSNSRIEDGVQSFPDDLHDAVHDTDLFLNNTDLEVHAIFVTNYGELQDVLFHKLDSSGELVKKELARVTQAVAIENLTAIAMSLGHVRADLTLLRNTTRDLQEVTQYLRSGLESVVARLRKHQKTCAEQPECELLQQQFIERLHINQDFTQYLNQSVLPQLPKVEHKLDEVAALLAGDIEAEVKRGKRAFDSIATEIQNKVQQSIPEIKDKIRQAGAQLSQAAAEVRTVLADVDVHKHTEPTIARISLVIKEYAPYRYYAFLCVCCVLLTVLASWVLAVLYGCCGRRADEAASCLKLTGASWMIFGVVVFFLVASVVLVVTAALFLVGSLAQVLVCEPLSNPTRSEVFSSLHSHLNIQRHYPQGESPTLMQIIDQCHRNESIYSVLKLHLLDDGLTSLLQYRDRLQLDEKMAQLKQKISVDTNVKILSRDAKQQLRALANSSLARRDDWANYAEILEQQVLTINLLEMAAQLNQTADQLPAGYEEVSIGLKNDALFLESLQRWLTAIRGHTKVLKETTDRLSGYLHYSNHTTLRPAIRRLINQAEYAQRYLRTNGSSEVIQLVERFSEDFLADVDDYVAHVQGSVEHRLGRCGPLSSAYNASTAAFCKDVLYPFNGFWVSVGWVFMVYLPCVVFALHLTSLYRKTEPWPGPLNESYESMYDAYAERDNIPLTSAYDKKPQRSREYVEAGASGHPSNHHNYSSPQGAPPPVVGFTGPAAPRHHDQPPIDGPPRYTSQPSLSPEYERPPPYYYPGPGNCSGGGQWSGGGGGGGGGVRHSSSTTHGGWKISPAYTRGQYDA
ncbi:prominin-1 isoform X3 [Hyalella azteca]|uniref:Prominin-1 isoform X3 n=1 Tax=Hyalella azteca TaxID=294128 RepID=A0A979FHI1_HYAAZ|nr:prominin-1 isoform X3 [Hyalella azteca]